MFKKKWDSVLSEIKKLSGDPHHIALGVAIGVFVAITPTMPFHTILALALAIILRASKPGALIGVWVSNPFTMVFLYLACFKTGCFFFRDASHTLVSIELLIDHLESGIDFSQKIGFFIHFIKTEAKTFMIMNAGGVLLGLPSGLFAYVITRKFFSDLRKTH